jgi:hypothetical protein
MTIRIVAALAILVGLVATPARPALAVCGSSASADAGDATFFASGNAVECETTSTTHASSDGAPAGTVQSQKVCKTERRSDLCDGGWVTCDNGETMELTYFYPADGSAATYVGSNCPERTRNAGGPSPADILRAFKQIPLPESVLNIQPPGGATLVNFETNFYTDAAPFERTVTLLGHRVRFKIRARSFAWHFGDKSSETTSRPGAAYPKLDVTHRYLTKGTVNPSVDTTWEADYQLDGGAWTPVNGTVTMRGAAQQLTIKSATPVLVG